MLEGLVTWVLNNYVGEYLENLNANQISVALLQGQVELENVPLRKTALQKFDIPLEVRSGVIGKLTLSIPITHIKSEPWVLKISDLLVLLGPNSATNSVEVVEQYEQTRKEQMLEELEKLHKKHLLTTACLEAQSGEPQNENGWWGASLVSAVSNNIQLILDNVHIRYEDDQTMPDGMPFNFGFRIQNISIQTTNAQWKAGFVQPDDGVNVFKKLDIKGFSVFWNCSQEMHKEIKNFDELKQLLCPIIIKSNTYILQPFSMQMRMEKNSSKFPLKQLPAIPRFKFDLRPEGIELELSKRQLAQMQVLTSEWSRFERARQHRKWRPLASIKGNVKEWWQFAYGRIVEQTRRQRSTASKSAILNRARLLNNYCRAYKRRLRAYVADEMAKQQKRADPTARVASASAVSQEDIAYMKQIDHDSQFTYNELQLFRETVFRRYIKELEIQRPFSPNDSIEVFELVSPESELSKSESSKFSSEQPSNDPIDKQSGNGLYGWVASWFGGAAPEVEKANNDDANRTALLDLWPKMEFRQLPLNLRTIEKNIEAEILDVLSESWDDSTILRRDTLLAELVLQLEKMIIRFVDDEEMTTNSRSRVLALDMRQLASRILLSPREHRTEVMLSVGDMGVQRLRISPQESSKAASPNQNGSFDNLADEESLMYGSNSSDIIEPEILFAIGRTKEADELSGSQSDSSKPEPLLQLFYRRLAPRMNIFHEVKVSLLPVSIVYDEDALDGLSNLFDTESAFDADIVGERKNQPGIASEYDPNVQLFLTINVPDVHLELRTKKLSLARENHPTTASASFVNSKITNVSIGVARTERFLTRMKIGFDNIVVNDLYETTDWPLLRTIPPPKPLAYTLKSRSNSSPDLSQQSSSPRKYSTSLPIELRNIKTISIDEDLRNNTPTKRPNRKNPPKVDNDFGHWDSTYILLNFTFVEDQHPSFEKTYKKQHCTVKANLSDVEVGMNRRTWTMLLNFFGALGQRPVENLDDKTNETVENDPILEGLLYGRKVSSTELTNAIKKQQENRKKVIPPYILRMTFEFAELSIHMNYPSNQTKLGLTAFSDVDFDMKLNLNDPEDPMRMALKIAEFSLLDSTPFYSSLYGERLSLKPTMNQKTNSKPKLSIDILKYRTDDLELKRKFDVRVDVKSENDISIYYVHTHRYFCAFLDYWLQFTELQDQVRRINEGTNYIAEAQKTRCLLKVDLKTPLTLILPLNQFSDQIICMEADSIDISNTFLLGSQLPVLAEHAIDMLRLDADDYDCLMESMKVDCSNVCIYTGHRHPVSRSKIVKRENSKEPLQQKRRIGETAFENFWFLIDSENVLNRSFQLTIDVYRNLSAFISHNLPDLAIINHFENLDLSFTTDFYCLLRGFLEKNLGDALIPVPETIPFELLQNPDRTFETSTSVKYITFSHRMVFKNFKFNFLLPNQQQNGYEPFGVVVLHKARISFDAYIDNQSELDLICESTELIDTRFDELPKNQRPNIFTTILSPCKKRSKLSSGNQIMLMSEAHIMMRKDEAPIVTLVLMNSRVLLILDWLNQAKDFVLMNTTFVPPDENTHNPVMLGAPKDGVLVRNLSTKHLPDYKSPHTITLKITLKESDLILLEDSSKSNSLALVGHTTAVLNLTDASGVLESNFEIQNMNLSWCLMSSEQSTSCQISNEFNLTVNMNKEMLLSKLVGAQKGLSNLEFGPRQTLKFEIGEVVCRMSYKDVLVVQSVIQGALKRPQTNLSKSTQNSLTTSPRNEEEEEEEKPSSINIKSVTLNAPNICAWLLDDSQNVALPLVRLVFSNLQMHYVGEKVETKMNFGVDYFNQRIFGWEPLIEPWMINNLLWQWNGQANILKIQPAIDCPLNFNVTQTFIQQAKHFTSKWPEIKRSLESDLRTMCVRLRSDHLPYLMRNETGSNLVFTTSVDEFLKARQQNQKSNAKWFTALPDRSCTFEFPTKLLSIRDPLGEPRQLIIRVDGWEEMSPVSVDSVGTYIRLIQASKNAPDGSRVFARLVIDITMEPNGRKVVVVRSAMAIINKLADPVRLIFTDPQIGLPSRSEVYVRAGATLFAPLAHVNSRLKVCPYELETVVSPLEIKWKKVRTPGDVLNKLVCFSGEEQADNTERDELKYWACVSIKHELYPEHEILLCGHSICFMPSLNVLNLLPNDVEFVCNKLKYTVQAGQRFQTASINLEDELLFSLSTDRFRSIHSNCIKSNSLHERADGSEASRILMQLFDKDNRELHVYASVTVICGGALNISLWVPYWIVNRSGIPLIIKQDSAHKEAAGQVTDHEKAKDRNPLMFSFADDGCPNQCVARVGKRLVGDPGFKPQFSRSFSLAPGVQSLKLLLTHDQLPTRVYNIGVEVRSGTGRYKDTQVVVFAPRYRLNNCSSHSFEVAHKDETNEPKKHIQLAANCNLIWHENYEDKRLLCIRRENLPHWSCPFRIDQVGSFHVTMRDKDETPRFIRVEISLYNASFWVTFTDANYFPAPIKIENLSNVPVLYQQAFESTREYYHRAICKANSTIEYAWDDIYGAKLMILQVYENKSHRYDPAKPSLGPQLIYETHMYIRFYPSFKRTNKKNLEEQDLVMTVRKEGKVQLVRQNLTDSSQSQLWLLTQDNCLENVGFNYRNNGTKYVLDVLNSAGEVIMMCPRNPERNSTQKWRFTNDGRLRCGLADRYVEVRGTHLVLAKSTEKIPENVPISSQGIPETQLFQREQQKPGSGVLDVQCLHVGPTLVVRITDHSDSKSSISYRGRRRSDSPINIGKNSIKPISDEETKPSWSLDLRLEMPAGIGISLIRNQCEELIYALFSGVELNLLNQDNNYRLNGHVNVVQIDNQLFNAERWSVLYCDANALKNDDLPESTNAHLRPVYPALKLEMSWTPMQYYDAFDCFRVKLCSMCLLLDEMLIWKLIQFVQETDTAHSVKPEILIQPPNIEVNISASSLAPTRRCYFGTLEMEMGDLSLSAMTVSKNTLSRDLRRLKEQFNVKLVSFENALVQLPPFRQLHCFETTNFLIDSLGSFYLSEVRKQTMNIVITMDAFGNPLGLMSDLKESFQTLFFEGDFSGFFTGLGYGVSNSLSKVISSAAQGVGSLTFDEKHELLRRRMLRSQSENSTPLTHLFGGVKGLGVGVFGLLTSLPKNTFVGAQQDGVPGMLKGIATGAFDSFTKPVQGVLDFVGGATSAIKDATSGQLTARSHFSEQRTRLPRVCTNLQALLPSYNAEQAEAQQELFRIISRSSNERLLDLLIILVHIQDGKRICHRALICTEQCYITRQVGQESSTVIQRVVYRSLRNIQPGIKTESGLVKIEVVYDEHIRKSASPAHMWCSNSEVAAKFSDLILTAKQLYDHSRRTLTVSEELDLV